MIQETKTDETTEDIREAEVPEKISKIVRFVLASNNRGANAYRSRPFMSAPIWNITKGKYLTGYEDMTNFAQIKTREKILKIDPNENYPIYHMMKLDLSNDRDKYFLDYAVTQDRIARTKAEHDSRPGYFYFYIEDKQMEAEMSLTSADEKFQAEMLVRQKLSHADYKDLGIWMGADVRLLTDVQLKDYLVGENGVCKTRPRDVINFFEKTNAEILFVRKLAFHGIIYKDTKGRGFYNDNTMQVFLGTTEAQVVGNMQKDDFKPYLNKWRESLKSIE